MMKYEKGTFVVVPNRDSLSDLGTHAQIVFVWLCYFANDDGVCYPGHELIMSSTKLSKPTVLKAIHELENAGFISKEARFVEQKQTSNLYQIMLIRGKGGLPRGKGGLPGGSTTFTQGGKGGLHELNTYITKYNELNPHSPPTYSESFLKFWESYPKKIGKGEAYRSWQKNQLPKVDVLLSAVEKQKNTKQWKRDGGQYIPNPATWLNQRRWEDEVEEVKTLIIKG